MKLVKCMPMSPYLVIQLSHVQVIGTWEWFNSVAVSHVNVGETIIFELSISCIVGMPKEITKAKIACLDFSLQKAKMQLGVSVVIDDPEKLEAIRKRYTLKM